MAPAAGVVNQSYSNPAGAGNIIQINHGGGWFTTYIHLQSRAVSVGTHVQRGTSIGRVGHTGETSNGVATWRCRIGGGGAGSGCGFGIFGGLTATMIGLCGTGMIRRRLR